jgi:hypothetical protein
MGVKLVMVEGPAGTARLHERLTPRNPAYVRVPADAGITFTARMLARIRRNGGRARMAQLTPQQRSELGRRAANARWRAKSSANSEITIITTADGTATAGDVRAWGFQQ